MRPAALAGLLAALALAIAGCREELGPVAFPTTRVSGAVLEAGRPVSGGWIEFLPVEGTVGNLRSAPIRADGGFEASGVAVGRNLIRLVHAPIRIPGGQSLFWFESPIRRQIPRGQAATLVIDVLEEAIRHQNEKAKQAAEPSR
jgi:hypothetical protein